MASHLPLVLYDCGFEGLGVLYDWLNELKFFQFSPPSLRRWYSYNSFPPHNFFILSRLEWWDSVLQKRLAWALFVFVVINPGVLLANRVDLGFFCFINFPILLPPPSPGLNWFTSSSAADKMAETWDRAWEEYAIRATLTEAFRAGLGRARLEDGSGGRLLF